MPWFSQIPLPLWRSSYKKDGDARRALLKWSTARAFAVAFVALSQNNIIGDDVLFLNWYLIEVKKSHASSTNSILVLFSSFL